MAEETPAPTGNPATPTPSGGETGQNQQPGSPSIRILSQYVKDMSFENPGMRQMATQPNIDLGIDVGATAHADGNNIFEVSIRIQAKATVENNVMFLLELDYSGLFQLQGFAANEVEPALLIECPRLIFPFARRVISDLTRDGGFPPLLVDPIDFRNLYLSQKQKQQAPAGGAPMEPGQA